MKRSIRLNLEQLETRDVPTTINPVPTAINSVATLKADFTKMANDWVAATKQHSDLFASNIRNDMIALNNHIFAGQNSSLVSDVVHLAVDLKAEQIVTQLFGMPKSALLNNRTFTQDLKTVANEALVVSLLPQSSSNVTVIDPQHKDNSATGSGHVFKQGNSVSPLGNAAFNNGDTITGNTSLRLVLGAQTYDPYALSIAENLLGGKPNGSTVS